MNTVVQQLREPLPETLSPAILAEYHLMPLTEALVNIHFPLIRIYCVRQSIG